MLFFCCPFVEIYAILKLLHCSTPSSWRKGVSAMNGIISFALSVAAGVVANYIYKWLDGQNKDSKH